MEIVSSIILGDIKTDEDVFVNVKCDIYSKINVRKLSIASDVVFYDEVRCSDVIVNNKNISVRFLGNLYCNTFKTDGDVIVKKELHVQDELSYKGKIACCKLIYRGHEMSVHGKIIKSEVVSQEENTEESLPISLPSKDLQIVFSHGVCDLCGIEKEVQIIYNQNGPCKALCRDCLGKSGEKHRSRKGRIPSDWEITNMTEEEKEFYARHGYVMFDSRTPSEPFICVRQESFDGELQYKELYVYDPEFRYLSEEDMENNRRKLRYNGGPIAWLLEGTFSTYALCAAMMVAPVIGPVAATLGLAASLPMSWKLSKKITNFLNDNFVLPSEIQVRKSLIESRKKDEKLKQDVHIEVA